MREKTVSGTYLIQGESVWLLHRTKHDWYELPGGKLDAGEAKDPSNPTLDELRAVAVREMAEETTGYTHGPLTYIRKIEVMRSPDVHLKSHQWAAKVTRGSVQIQETENFSNAILIPILDMHTIKLSPNITEGIASLKEKLLAFARKP